MSELHKFLFDGLPVRGMVVRLTDAWLEILARRSANSATGAYPPPVQALLGEMAAAAVLMQANIKFDGALVLQIFGAGPVKLAVAEVQPELGLRATATLVGEVPVPASLGQMVNVGQQGRCAITLEPRRKLPGQQSYQGVVPLQAGPGESFASLSAVLEHYMLQSEQLHTTLVLAANDQVAAGLLIQRMPRQGSANLAGQNAASDPADSADSAEDGHEDYQRIAILAASLQREELLTLDVETILRRLFWQEKLLRFTPQDGADGGADGGASPHFACNCSRERVEKMVRGLGSEEADSIVAERGKIEVGCEFCGMQYRFDAIDVAQIFGASSAATLPTGPALH